MNMKRIGTLAAAFALTAFAACTLAGCGASLDREVTVQDITFKVPKTWLESPGGNGSSGAVVFTEDNEDLDEDETGNSLTISYEKLGAPTAAVVEEQVGAAEQEGEVIEEEGAKPAEKAESAKPVARTAAEAIAAKQADLEKKYGISAWSIDKEKSKVIDGARCTSTASSRTLRVRSVSTRARRPMSSLPTRSTRSRSWATRRTSTASWTASSCKRREGEQRI